MVWNASLPADSSKIRLSAGYIRNNFAAIQSVLTASNLTSAIAYIPPTHPIFFYSDTAPSGWTATGIGADSLLGIKGGSVFVTGGTQAGTWQQQDVDGVSGKGLNVNQMPAHTHTFLVNTVESGFAIFGGANQIGASPQATSSTGSSAGTGGTSLAHNHGNLWRPAASVGIFCSKNA